MAGLGRVALTSAGGGGPEGGGGCKPAGHKFTRARQEEGKGKRKKKKNWHVGGICSFTVLVYWF
jgi:hypothetical protein